jgi:hypothetical protein
VPSQIKAKMQVYSNKPGSVDTTGKKESEQVTMTAVYSNEPGSENYSFSKATPSATLSMYINNPDAFDFFQEGKQYIVTFEPVE